MITNKGIKVFPDGLDETYCTDHWRCRFVSEDVEINVGQPDYKAIDYDHVLALVSKLFQNNFDVIKTENLYGFGGERVFSLGQSE